MDLTEVRPGQSRSGRTQVNLGGYQQAPSVQTRPVANDVPEFESRGKGLEGLQDVFANFYNTAQRSLDKLGEATDRRMAWEHQKAREQARADKERQEDLDKAQARNDFALGKEPDPAKANSVAYMDVMHGLIGNRKSIDLYNDWKADVLDKTPLDSPVDILAATEDYLKKEVGKGTGNQIFDDALLTGFWKQAEKSIGEFKGNRQKLAKTRGVGEVLDNITAQVTSGQFQPQNIRDAIDAIRVVDPDNYEEAPKLALNRFFSLTQGDPKMAQIGVNYLYDKSAGINGKSPMETWPEAAREMEAKYVNTVNNGLTAESNKAWNDLEERLAKAEKSDDPAAEFGAIALEADRTKDRYGNFNRWQSIQGQVANKLQAYAKEAVDLNYFKVYADNTQGNEPDAIPDVDRIKKGQLKYFNGIGGYEKDPVQSGVIVDRVGVIADDIKRKASFGLRNLIDPKAFENSFQFYRAIANGNRGEAGALEMMDQESRSIFLRASAMYNQGMTDVGQIASTIQASQADYEAIKKKPLAELLGVKTSNGKTAEQQLDEQIKSELTGKIDEWGFDPKRVFREPNMGRLRELVMNELALGGMNGLTDWKGAVTRAMRVAADNISVTPVSGGNTVVEVGSIPSARRFSTSHFYEGRRKPQDDVSVYRSDIKSMINAFPDIQLNGADADDEDSYAAAWDGREDGYRISHESTQVVFSEDQIQKLKDLDAVTKERFFFKKRYTTVDGKDVPLYELYYRPGPVDGPMKTVADKEREYKSPAQKPTPSELMGDFPNFY